MLRNEAGLSLLEVMISQLLFLISVMILGIVLTYGAEQYTRHEKMKQGVHLGEALQDDLENVLINFETSMQVLDQDYGVSIIGIPLHNIETGTFSNLTSQSCETAFVRRYKSNFGVEDLQQWIAEGDFQYHTTSQDLYSTVPNSSAYMAVVCVHAPDDCSKMYYRNIGWVMLDA